MERIKEGVEVAIKTGNWAQRNPLALAFCIMIVSIAGTWITMNNRDKDKDEVIERQYSEIGELKRELKEWQTIIVPGLRKVAPQVAETKEKLDSIINTN